jgi:hypothetical protein
MVERNRRDDEKPIMRCVVIESPYSGDVERNLVYLRECMRDCLKRGEAPFASHGLYTQPGVLDDSKPEERKLGMVAGFEIGRRLDATVLYLDHGCTSGMMDGVKAAYEAGRDVEARFLYPPKKQFPEPPPDFT